MLRVQVCDDILGKAFIFFIYIIFRYSYLVLGTGKHLLSICLLPIGNLRTWPNCYHHLFTCAASRTDSIPCAPNITINVFERKVWGNDSYVSLPLYLFLNSLSLIVSALVVAGGQSWAGTTKCQTGVGFPSAVLVTFSSCLNNLNYCVSI